MHNICTDLSTVYILDEDSPTTLIFVGGDGVQHSPMQFPVGHHASAFLSCLESGLAPYNRLDPPLWISKDKGRNNKFFFFESISEDKYSYIMFF